MTQAPKSQLPLLLTVGSLVMGSVLYNFVTRPAMATGDEVMLRAGELEKDLESQRLLTNQLQRLQEDNTRMENQLTEAYREFPQQERISERIESFETLARELKIKTSELERTVEASGIDGVDRTALSVNMLGQYNQISTLISRLEQEGRFISIDNIEMNNDGGRLRTKLEMSSYMMRPAPPTPAQNAAAPAAPPEGAVVPPEGPTGDTP